MADKTPRADRLAAELLPQLSALTRALSRGASNLSRTQISVLRTLRDEGPARISDLAAGERVAQPSMTTLVNRLERQGMVERSTDPADLRAVRVSITDAGREALATAVAEIEARLATQLGRLSGEDREALAAVLPVLIRLNTPTP
jgi:DNA-binding MarR family transcriptional regulator